MRSQTQAAAKPSTNDGRDEIGGWMIAKIAALAIAAGKTPMLRLMLP